MREEEHNALESIFIKVEDNTKGRLEIEDKIEEIS